MSRKAIPPYRAGIVGIRGPTGGIGGRHARAARTHGARVVAVCDLNPAGFEPFRAHFGPVETYTDIHAMLAAHELDLISIATSDHAHCELVEAACRAGIPMIFCEKPLDVTLERGDRMVRAVEESGATFLCDHTRRWFPTWVTAWKILKEQFGPVARAHAYIGSSSAMLYRNGTHLIDALCWFVGDEPAWLVGGEFEDVGGFDPNPAPAGLLGFRNGCRAFIDFTKKGTGDFEIDCICDGGRLTINRSGIFLTRDERGLGMTHTRLPAAWEEPEPGMTIAMRELMDAYEEGRPTQSTIRDALRALEIMTGLVRSHDQGGARITWPLDRTATTPSEGKLGYDTRIVASPESRT